jgi:hypothetical protein
VKVAFGVPKLFSNDYRVFTLLKADMAAVGLKIPLMSRFAIKIPDM